jgi:peptide/nickel transport system substrate-binding protein
MVKKALILALMSLTLTCALPDTVAQAATLKWAANGDAPDLDPYTHNDAVQLSLLLGVYEPLVRRDRNLALEPALAVRWEQTAPTVWRFHLRPGVKWQDGAPFTADDVVFSAVRFRDERSPMRGLLSSMKAARAVDDLTVDIETTVPDPILPQEQTNWMIMPRRWSEAHNAQEVTAPTDRENYTIRNTMGTGPFRITQREPDRRTVFERNPDWWDKPEHNLDRVEFNVIANAATRVAALLSGEIDMVYAVPTPDMERIGHTAGFNLIQGPELRTVYLGMNQMRDQLYSSDVKGRNPFKDRRVREAFALAIDEPAIATRIMRGQAHPTWLLWGPGINGYNAALDHRPDADPVRAKQLLAEAGYPDGFALTMDCPNDRYVNDESICTAVAAMLARVGVKVTVNARTKARYFAEIGAPEHKTDFYMLGWTPATYDAHNTLYNVPGSRDGSRGGENHAGYASPPLDALIDRIAVENEPAGRQELIDRAAVMLQQDFAFIPLHQQVIVWAAKANVGLAQTGDNIFSLRFVTIK